MKIYRIKNSDIIDTIRLREYIMKLNADWFVHYYKAKNGFAVWHKENKFYCFSLTINTYSMQGNIIRYSTQAGYDKLSDLIQFITPQNHGRKVLQDIADTMGFELDG